jgi:hypothetical protein
MYHLTCTKDPVSLNDVPLTMTQYVLNEKDSHLTIYFESQQNLNYFRNMHVQCPGKDFVVNLDNPIDEVQDCGKLIHHISC